MKAGNKNKRGVQVNCCAWKADMAAFGTRSVGSAQKVAGMFFNGKLINSFLKKLAFQLLFNAVALMLPIIVPGQHVGSTIMYF